jgi:hypothetical protein
VKAKTDTGKVTVTVPGAQKYDVTVTTNLGSQMSRSNRTGPWRIGSTARWRWRCGRQEGLTAGRVPTSRERHPLEVRLRLSRDRYGVLGGADEEVCDGGV